MPPIEHLQSITLDLPPSCIEFYPIDPHYAVIGTYNLEREEGDQPTEEDGQRKSQQRNGSLILIKVEDGKVYALPANINLYCQCF